MRMWDESVSYPPWTSSLSWVRHPTPSISSARDWIGLDGGSAWMCVCPKVWQSSFFFCGANSTKRVPFFVLSVSLRCSSHPPSPPCTFCTLTLALPCLLFTIATSLSTSISILSSFFLFSSLLTSILPPHLPFSSFIHSFHPQGEVSSIYPIKSPPTSLSHSPNIHSYHSLLTENIQQHNSFNLISLKAANQNNGRR